MKYFAVFLPMLDQEKSGLYREQHLAYLDQRRSEGRIFANGRFADGWGGLVIYKADAYDHVKQMVEEDPYVMLKARSYEIHEWEIVIART
ncbi:YciI family protein [Paenibacillus rigui]|uniref:YCII-related domain-containing protein n=1 Tax=Paenibacillus rigui TaxID=554312 RepID=A0A229UJK2_9BACL|nr:YciI family protein [Paenibacillus rigui]OXM83590.1 hypothetical protein CF651_25135 [Paenibacillus rigui]